MRIGIYPGTFDPVTNGHLDIIKRASMLVDKLYVVVSCNPQKKTLFTTEERVKLLKELLDPIDKIEVVSTNMLTVDFAESVGAKVMIRGLRMVTDFEYELQMATINKAINDKIETIFIMSSHEYSFLSSSSVKEVAKFNGDVSGFVPSNVVKALNEKFNIK